MERIARTTNETDIKLSIEFGSKKRSNLDLPLPFFAHLLDSMSLHGGFYLDIQAQGDIQVDPHHLVEDIGIVMGKALALMLEKNSHQRFGERRIPMDEALSEVVIDACKRSYLVYKVKFPQEYCGNFPLAILREFFLALAQNAGMTIHCICHYGENSHHMAEALFKALGKAMSQAFSPIQNIGNGISTKGSL